MLRGNQNVEGDLLTFGWICSFQLNEFNWSFKNAEHFLNFNASVAVQSSGFLWDAGLPALWASVTCWHIGYILESLQGQQAVSKTVPKIAKQQQMCKHILDIRWSFVGLFMGEMCLNNRFNSSGEWFGSIWVYSDFIMWGNQSLQVPWFMDFWDL